MRRTIIAVLVFLVSISLLVSSLSLVLAQGKPSLSERAKAGGGPPLSGAVSERKPETPAPPPKDRTPPLSDDVRVTTNGLPQNEPTVSHNPAAPSNLVAGANDYRLGDTSPGYYLSSDGGASWTQALLPRLGYEAAGDPAVNYGTEDKVHYSYLAFNRSDYASAIVVATLAGTPTVDMNGMVTNATISIVASSLGDPFHDKPFSTVDVTPGSPRYGNIYVTWTQFNFNADGSFKDTNIMFSRSTDGGLSFSSPLTVSGALTLNQGSLPVVGPDGTLYVVWQDFGGGRHAIVKSADGGSSFSAPATVSSVSNLPSPLPGSRFRTNSFPTAKVGPDGTVYVAWANWERWTVAGPNANIRLAYSTDGGTTWSGNGNWAAANILNTQIVADQFFPWIAGVDPAGNLHVLFYDRRDDRSNKEFHTYRAVFNKDDPGALSNIRITEVASDPRKDGFGGKFIGDYIGATYNGSPVGVWTDTRTGNAEVFTDPNG